MERKIKINGVNVRYEYSEDKGWYTLEYVSFMGYSDTSSREFVSIDKLEEHITSYYCSEIIDSKGLKNTIRLIAGGVVLVLLIVLFTLSTYNIKNGYQAVLRNSFTGEARVETESGFSTKLPWEDIQKVSIAEQTYKREDSANTKDNVQLTYNFKVSWKVSDLDKLWNKKYAIDIDSIKVIINKETTKVLDMVSNKYEYDYIKSNISSIGDEMTKLANQSMSEYGIEIVGIDIVDIVAPESIENAINAKIKKQQQAEASKFDVEKARNEADAQKVKQNSVSQEQQQMEMCEKAISAGNANSPACYFGDKMYVNVSK